jgi:protein-L-isoaspartate(D-aspartate) O-methyltransferase
MVEQQLRQRGIVDERVLAAMAEIPRERFLPESRRSRAYDDAAVDIGHGQTMSQPWVVAATAALLELTGEERVLDVGTGSGYAAAVLSHLAAEVVSVEVVPELAERARTTLEELGYAVEVRVGDGSRGAPDRAPFGGILVSAAAEGHPPRPLLDQLDASAALVCPVRRDGDERLVRYRGGTEESLASVRFVPLVSAPEA